MGIPTDDVLHTELELSTVEFWFMIRVAMLCGFATAHPVKVRDRAVDGGAGRRFFGIRTLEAGNFLDAPGLLKRHF